MVRPSNMTRLMRFHKKKLRNGCREVVVLIIPTCSIETWKLPEVVFHPSQLVRTQRGPISPFVAPVRS